MSKKPLVIYLVGAQDVGKTTLLEYFRSRERVHVVEEAASKILYETPPADRPASDSPALQDMIFDLQVELERDAFERVENGEVDLVVADRSVIDIMIYSLVSQMRFPENGFEFKQEWVDYMSKRMVSNKQHDTLVALCDYNIPYDPRVSRTWGGVTEEEIAKALGIRIQLHENFESFMNEHGIPFMKLEGTPQYRIFVLERMIDDRAIIPEGTVHKTRDESMNAGEMHEH